MVDLLEPGGRLDGARRLRGGVSAEVFALDILTLSGTRRRIVLRRHRSDGVKGHSRRIVLKEHALLAALRDAGMRVPEPYLHDVSDPDGPYLVAEWIDGSTDVDVADLPTALDQMARFLVGLHALDLSAVALPGLDLIEDPGLAIEPHLPSTDDGERVRVALRSGALDDEPNRAVLLHGDYWPGNVLWRDGLLRAVIDWEDACLGDQLADLATVRVELWCRYGPEAAEAFTERYLYVVEDAMGPLRVDQLVLWDLYVSAAALTHMGEWGLTHREEARRRSRTEGFFRRAARALG